MNIQIKPYYNKITKNVVFRLIPMLSRYKFEVIIKHNLTTV